MSKRNFSQLAQKMYDGSYFTFEGCDLENSTLGDWVNKMNNILKSEGCPTVPQKAWVTFTGEDMNKEYNLTGNNKYPRTIHFLAFPLDNFKSDEDIQKISMIKLVVGARWFDDIVENNAERERRKNNV